MDFKILPIKNRELFLKYAIPCGEVLVGRGELKPDLLMNLDSLISNGQEVDFPIEDVFKVASRMCTILAKHMGKTVIDDEVIRRYFLVEHEKAIRWRKQVKPDIILKECMVYPGKVKQVDENEGRAVVQTPLGEALLKSNFLPGIREGDLVSTHYDRIAEKLKPEYLRKMKKIR